MQPRRAERVGKIPYKKIKENNNKKEVECCGQIMLCRVPE